MSKIKKNCPNSFVEIKPNSIDFQGKNNLGGLRKNDRRHQLFQNRPHRRVWSLIDHSQNCISATRANRKIPKKRGQTPASRDRKNHRRDQGFLYRLPKSGHKC